MLAVRRPSEAETVAPRCGRWRREWVSKLGDAALGASDESNFMSDQEFIPDGGVSTLMAAFPA